MTTIRPNGSIVALILACVFGGAALAADEPARAPRYNPLSMIPRELVQQQRIHKVTICMVDAARLTDGPEAPDRGCSPENCVNQTYTFDHSGRVVAYDFHRMASSLEVTRDPEGALIQAVYVDKMSSERTVWWERGTDPPEDQPTFEMGETQGNPGETRVLSDPCFSIDGVYQITYEITDGLPTTGEAIRIEDIQAAERDTPSPEKIRLLFVYERFVDEQTPPEAAGGNG